MQVRLLISITRMKHYITTNPKILGGQPCIVGTRIPVSLILIRLKQGHTLKEIQEMYHWVPLTTFEEALEELAKHVGDSVYDPHSVQA
jgi:uncharacterized protein (DUF433 family)